MIAYYRQGMSYTNYLSLSKYKNEKLFKNYSVNILSMILQKASCSISSAKSA